MSLTAPQFLQALSESGIVTPEAYQAIEQSLGAIEKVNPPEALAQRLVREQKITAYQAEVLLVGMGSALRHGEYLIVDRLGGGQMADVFKAIHRETKAPVALKVILPGGRRSPDSRARLAREAEAIALLKHPNIASMKHLVDTDDDVYLVMEYVQGQNLEDMVTRKGPLPVAQAVDCVLQAATGMDYAHQRGIVHRDLKPKNLIRKPDGVVKILDLSLVRLDSTLNWDESPGHPTERLTKLEMVIGTPFFMAPEQFADARQADWRSDVYSLGCTLYFLLTEQPPYVRATPLETVKAHLVAPIPSLSAIRADVPAGLQSAFSIMVAKNVDDRYQTMAEVITDLRAMVPAKVK